MDTLGSLAPEAAGLFLAHPVRKSKAQKQAFRQDALEVLRRAGWPAEVESAGRLPQNHNLVAGSIKDARLVLTAHYDTPARLPFPNFIAPRNLPATLLYQMLLALAVFVLYFAATFGAAWLGVPLLSSTLLGLALLLGLLFLLVAGPANPSNANDNSSGVVCLLQIAHTLPLELRGRVALVFFDNEELGLLGSAQFRKKHGALGQKLLLNFDCVGDGDTILLALKGAARREETLAPMLQAAFAGGELPGTGAADAPAAILVDRSPLTFYPSDQLLFKRAVGVAALRRAPLVGYYLARVHTRRDTVLNPRNILQLSRGAARLAAAMVNDDIVQ